MDESKTYKGKDKSQCVYMYFSGLNLFTTYIRTYTYTYIRVCVTQKNTKEYFVI